MERPGFVSYWIICSCLLGFVFSRNLLRYPIEENLDHPARSTRYFYRYCLFCCCFLLSFFISPLVLVHLPYPRELRDAEQWVRGAAIVALLLPLATVLYWSFFKFKRRFVAKPALAPYSSATAMLPASLPPVPPMRIAMDEDTKRLDPNDDEAVRTLARKHWGAIQAAIEGRGDINEANIASTAVFDLYVPSLPPDVGRRVRDIYMAECDLQAGLGLVQMELAAAQRAEAVVAETRRKRRFALIIFVMLLVPVIGMIAVLATRL